MPHPQTHEDAIAFLAAYGWTMWAVQRFEYRLAGLSILRAPVKSPSRLIDTPQKAYSALQKQFAVYHHRFERASANELRNHLPDDLPELLQAEIDELIEVRNDLAHRYLRRSLEGSSAVDLITEREHVKRLGERFAAAGDELLALMERAVADCPPNVSETQFAALQQLGRAAASGAALDDALHNSVL
jgi:hypothetical protein